ncbi:hypothetical protein [Campylobacter sp. 2018MI10]|uniref:hypothetical protein n=2 Tax=unclassified Campylobacter TaxID=2593542 RepID=UPI001BDAA47F|nr:hypothetical protein [Campylobacter sp. 2018MI10]MBT0884503.1 hypothetical protein [Campylobacter sp. 2018MI10]
MKKIIFSLLCCSNLLISQTFIEFNTLGASIKDKNNIFDNDLSSTLNASVYLYKMDNYDNDFVGGIDFSHFNIYSRFFIGNQGSKTDIDLYNLTALGGYGFYSDIYNISLSLLGGVGYEKAKYNLSSDIIKNANFNKNLKSNLLTLGIAAKSYLDSNLILGMRLFTKHYTNNNIKEKSALSGDISLGYSISRQLNGFYTQVKVGYDNNLVGKGVNFGIGLGYSF